MKLKMIWNILRGRTVVYRAEIGATDQPIWPGSALVVNSTAGGVFVENKVYGFGRAVVVGGHEIPTETP